MTTSTWILERAELGGTTAVVISRAEVQGYGGKTWMHSSGRKDVVAVLLRDGDRWRCTALKPPFSGDPDPLVALLREIDGLEAFLEQGARP